MYGLQEAREWEVAGRVGACGVMPLPGAHNVTVHSRGDGHRHMGGLAYCGRFQVCPSCTPYLAHRRLEALESLSVKLAADTGLRHFMAVLTLRHHRGARFRALVDALRKMLASLRQGHLWRDAVAGYIRLAETTYGEHGHHPHFHLLLSVRGGEGWEPEGFFAWVQHRCAAMARKAGRTCDFTNGWWSEVPRERLLKSVRYFFASDKLGTSSFLFEIHSSGTKHMPIWCIPAKAYAEVYRDSKGMRWYSVGGCWKDQATAKSDEELEQERQETGQVIAHIRQEVWKAWTPQERRDRRAVVSDSSLTDAQVVECLLVWGGAAGPPISEWEPPSNEPDSGGAS